MALRIHFFSPNTLPQPQKFQTYPFPTTTTTITFITKPIKTQKISCSNSNNINDAELASELATEVLRINTQLVMREEAMKKSRELLFTEFCQYLSLKEEEVKKKWKRMNEEEKFDLVKGFVSMWGTNFHPLSTRSVKEMVDEYLHEDILSPTSSSSSSFLFPGLKRMMGFGDNSF